VNGIPQPAENYWAAARHILHFVGICGAGKSSLCATMAKLCESRGAKTVGTIDYDPHTPDDERAEDRAFSRELDRLNNEASRNDADVHRQIVQLCLAALARWRDSHANVVLVDRWYESYDDLPAACVQEIEDAIAASGFKMHHVLLLVGGPNEEDVADAIQRRLIATKQTRPDSWWPDYPARVAEFVGEEVAYQIEYSNFCKRGKFPYIAVHTDDMDWDRQAKHISFDVQRDVWIERFDAWWPSLSPKDQQTLRDERMASPIGKQRMCGMMPPRPVENWMLDHLPHNHAFWTAFGNFAVGTQDTHLAATQPQS